MSMSRRIILIVDDEPAQRDRMRRILYGEAYGVFEAADLAEALAVQEWHPGEIDLALIDLVLPDGNGYDLYQTLAARQQHLRVLFTSGQVGAELRKFLNVRMPDMHFLRKPFDAAELLDRVRTVFEAADPFADAAAQS